MLMASWSGGQPNSRCCGAVGLPSVTQRPQPMHRSARTAQTIRPSRSGSSTMQPATGQAAWQIEQANAPKQRSGSITAMVFGAFLRGPDIILVHIWTGIIAESAERMPRCRFADLRHHGPQRGGVLEDQSVGVGGEE